MVPLYITTDFDCSNAENIERLSDSSFRLTCRSDNAHNLAEGHAYAPSDFYYAFRIHNENSEPVQARVETITHMYEKNNNVEFCYRTLAVRPVPRDHEPSYRDWRVMPASCEEVDLKRSMSIITFDVPGNTVLDVTDMYWYSAAQVEHRLFELKQMYPFITLRSLGKTNHGRDIWAVTLPCPGKKPAVVAATPQCCELGTTAVMELIEAGLRGELNAINKYEITFVPVTNPDGNMVGACMSNADGENIVFGFNNDPLPAECAAMWKLLHERKPAFFLEIHSYPHQDRPSFRPYEFDPILYPDTESRMHGMRFMDAIKRVSPNRSVYQYLGGVMEKNWQVTAPQKLVREGVPATIYKLHNRETIVDNVQHAVKLLNSIAEEDL